MRVLVVMVVIVVVPVPVSVSASMVMTVTLYRPLFHYASLLDDLMHVHGGDGDVPP